MATDAETLAKVKAAIDARAETDFVEFYREADGKEVRLASLGELQALEAKLAASTSTRRVSRPRLAQ